MPNVYPGLQDRYEAARKARLGDQLTGAERTERVRIELGNAFSAGAIWQYQRSALTDYVSFSVAALDGGGIADVAAHLDRFGVTLVTAVDPVDGSHVQVISSRDAALLLAEIEKRSR